MRGLIKTRQSFVILGLSVLVLAGIVALIVTRNSGSQTALTKPRWTPLVDEQPLQTARSLVPLATSREEQRYAQQALRFADHAVDLAFADAIREATLHPTGANGESKALIERVKRAEAQVKSDQELIDSLQKESKSARKVTDGTEQQLALLQAQLELDKDDLEDAKGDLLRSGADPLSRIQRQFTRYQAAQQQNNAISAQLTVPAAESNPPHDLIAQFTSWRTLGAKAARLQQARDEASQKHDQLQQRHDAAEQSTAAAGNGNGSQAAESSAGTSQDEAVIATLRRLSEHQKTLSDLDKRIQDHRDLADVYGNWLALVQARQRDAMRSMLRLGILIVLVILGVYLTDVAVDRSLAGLISDRRRARTLRVVVHFVVEASGVLIVLFILLGVPNQMPTILGLAGAGLTVALKDFIVAFFGWFALMGRNGIRVGDWVEIQGVVGEVIEIGLLRTVLLETGNWNDAGHPTGRKVAFVNSFAIEGHYFNFSTSGQWLWDELQILVPSNQNPYPILSEIQKLVTTATEGNARTAEDEWQRVTQRGTQREHIHSVSAAPAINLRPTPSGVEVHVRYITRANERYATRNKLYQDIVALLHQRRTEPVSATSEP